MSRRESTGGVMRAHEIFSFVLALRHVPLYCAMYTQIVLNQRCWCCSLPVRGFRPRTGAGTTFLATAFESWMVTEHHIRGFPSHLVGDTFRMSMWAIGAATIASGFAADGSVKVMGLVGPFNLAIGVRPSASRMNHAPRGATNHILF